MSDKEQELLPCPFCGNTDVRFDQSHDTESWFANCNDWDNCGALIELPNATAEQVSGAWNRRAARGDEPGEWAPVKDGVVRNAYTDIAINVEDKGARLLVWNYDTVEPYTVPIDLPPHYRICRRTEHTEQSGMSDEERQILELVRLMQQLLDESDQFSSTYRFSIVPTRDSIIAMEHGKVMNLSEAISLLRSRLAPKPQRPTAESMIAEMRNIKTSDDLWDWWQDTLEDWGPEGSPAGGDSE